MSGRLPTTCHVAGVGVFGEVAKLDAPLPPGDRSEIYHAITCDSQSVLRRDMEDGNAGAD